MSIIVYIILAIGIALAIVGAAGLIIAGHGERLGIVRTGPIFDPQPEDYDMGTLCLRVRRGEPVYLQLPPVRGRDRRDGQGEIRISVERITRRGYVRLAVNAPPDVTITGPERTKPAAPSGGRKAVPG